jgi:hypothetical protein
MSIASVGFSKLSTVFLYRRIFTQRIFRIVTNAYITVLIGWLLCFQIATLFQCTPVSTLWTQWEYNYAAHCVQILPYYYAVSTTDTLTDIFILVLPWRATWKLQLPMKQRLAVGGMFLMGIL